MATARDIIKRSLRLLGVYSPGESLSDDSASDGLLVLNSMLDSWNSQSLLIYNIAKVTHTLVSGTGSYTIGSGGDIDTTRPQRVENAYITDSNSQDYHVDILFSDEQYSKIGDKTTQSSYPCYLYYRAAFPLGTILLWPVPDTANTLTLSVWNQISAIANLSTDVALPPGYQRAIEYNLALELADEYGSQPSGVVTRKAMESLSNIKTINSKEVPILKRDFTFSRRGPLTKSQFFGGY